MNVDRPRPGSQPFNETSLGVMAAIVSSLIAIASLLWLTGELSARLTSGSFTGTSAGEMGRVLVRWVRSLADPGAAWPRPARRLIPGPFVFYAVFALLTGTLAAAALKLAPAFRNALKGDPSTSGSRWARPSDLRALLVRAPSRGRLILGRVNGRSIAAEERHSVIVLGPTQSMKTTGFAIPALLEWEGPVLATSVKSDLVRDTIAARRARGEVWLYDPSGSIEGATSRWSPLGMCGDWRGAQRTAMWLSSAARARSAGLSDAEFWYAAATKLLAPHLLAARLSGATMADVVRWINTQEEREVERVLRSCGVSEALDAARASWQREARQRSSVYTTLETVLAAYEDPVVAASAESSDISAEGFLDGECNTIFVAAPSHEQRRLRPLFETLLQTILNHAYERSARDGRPLDPPLLVVLDEAANIAPLRDLDSLASTAAGHGIQLVSIFQDLAQVSARYPDSFQTVTNNHRCKIILSGVSDTQTLEYTSRLLGDEEVLQASVTRGGHGARSTTESPSLRSLAPAHVLRSIRPGEGILVYGHLPPARIQLRPWFSDRSLRKLARP